MADAPAPARRKGFNASNPGAKEYLIVGGAALLIGLAYLYWKNHTAGSGSAAASPNAAVATDANGNPVPGIQINQGTGTDTGAGLASQLQDQQSSPVTTATGGSSGGAGGAGGAGGGVGGAGSAGSGQVPLAAGSLSPMTLSSSSPSTSSPALSGATTQAVQTSARIGSATSGVLSNIGVKAFNPPPSVFQQAATSIATAPSHITASPPLGQAAYQGLRLPAAVTAPAVVRPMTGVPNRTSGGRAFV